MNASHETAPGATAMELHGIAARLLRHPRLIVGLPALCFVLAVTAGLVRPRTYTVAATFRPQSNEGNASKLAGLAAQFGVNVPLPGESESADFYAELLRSREMLTRIVEAQYACGEGGKTAQGDLVACMGIKRDTRGLALEEATRRLRRDLKVGLSPKTNIVSFSVRARDSSLALSIADTTLGLINQFNLERRQSNAKQERRFIEGRIADVQQQSDSLEQKIEQFLRSNREYRLSPQLTFEYERLQRQLNERRQVSTTLQQSLERARLDEVRDTPVITVLDRPASPFRPDRRMLLLRGVLGLAAGLLLGMLAAFALEGSRDLARQDPRGRDEVVQLARDVPRQVLPRRGAGNGDRGAR
jgi:uncharacterized protein involved in exopolysaccharide biosynthesis